MAKTTILTGIKPTGTPHIGNLIGAIQPALNLAKGDDVLGIYFIADYHALTTVKDPKEFKGLVHQIAATWLAAGLDPEKLLFYRHSDIPEIFELTWIISCVTPKGYMNKAHAYKAAVDRNREKGLVDGLDAGINMGLYNYPVLMAADILLFNSNFVPVGKDQIQHVEIARDIAEHFNNQYGETLVLPKNITDEDGGYLPGTDGRKMSKSYGNVIPVFSTSKVLRKSIMRIKTDSTDRFAPKDPDNSIVFDIYKQFATEEQTADLRQSLLDGMQWGDAKQALFELLDGQLSEARETYNSLMADTKQIDAILAEGAEKARRIATKTIQKVRKRIGKN